MDLNFSEAELQFQQEVRQFLAENLPQHIIDGTANNSSVFVEKDIALEWQAILVDKGWAVPQWPVEHGGTDWSPAQKYLFSKECYHAGAPMLIPLGIAHAGTGHHGLRHRNRSRNTCPKSSTVSTTGARGTLSPGPAPTWPA